MEIGIDCVDIKRFSGILTQKKLLQRIFTEREVTYCRSRKPSAQHFAARFAAKEAVLKALAPWGVAIPMNRLEILNRDDGTAFASIHDKRLKALKVRISLSHSQGIAMAVALVEGSP